jgi:hypothetical protein
MFSPYSFSTRKIEPRWTQKKIFVLIVSIFICDRGRPELRYNRIRFFVNNDLKNASWCDNFQKICDVPWSLVREKITVGANDA